MFFFFSGGQGRSKLPRSSSCFRSYSRPVAKLSSGDDAAEHVTVCVRACRGASVRVFPSMASSTLSSSKDSYHQACPHTLHIMLSTTLMQAVLPDETPSAQQSAVRLQAWCTIHPMHASASALRSGVQLH